MYDSDDFESLFNDDWRDPTDGGERAAIYVLMAFGLIVGVVGAGFSIATLVKPELWGPSKATVTSLRILSSVTLVITLLIGIGSAAFFASERKHFHIFPITAEKVVTASFTLVVALVILGVQMMSGHPGLHENPLPAAGMMWTLAGALFIASLALGLVCAYWPQISKRKRKHNATVDMRYGVDDLKNWVEDPAAPYDFDLVPIVALRLSDGETLKLRCEPRIYDLSVPGTFGQAIVQGKRLVDFRRIK